MSNVNRSDQSSTVQTKHDYIRIAKKRDSPSGSACNVYEDSDICVERLIVLCEMVLCETKRNEMKSVLCEMKICTLRNEICTLRNENLYFAK